MTQSEWNEIPLGKHIWFAYILSGRKGSVMVARRIRKNSRMMDGDYLFGSKEEAVRWRIEWLRKLKSIYPHAREILEAYDNGTLKVREKK